MPYHETKGMYLVTQLPRPRTSFSTGGAYTCETKFKPQLQACVNYPVSEMIHTRSLASLTARLKGLGHLTYSLPRQYYQYRLMHTGRDTGVSVILDCDNVQVCESSESQTAILVMKRNKVNCFNQSFLEDFSRCIKTAENKQYNTLIISSAIQGVFSAGLDFEAVLNQRRENVKALWNAMQDAWIDLYSTRLLTIAAINGHCLAGGCVFAFSCDSRIALTGSIKLALRQLVLV